MGATRVLQQENMHDAFMDEQEEEGLGPSHYHHDSNPLIAARSQLGRELSADPFRGQLLGERRAGVVQGFNLGHQLLLPPTNWCPTFASGTTQLAAVVGSVGAGKSTILAALLGCVLNALPSTRVEPLFSAASRLSHPTRGLCSRCPLGPQVNMPAWVFV